MKFKTLLTAVLLSLSPLSAPASPLSDLAEQHGVAWMMGSWTGAEGKIKLTYEWRVDKNAIAVKFEAGERTAEGIMALKPGTEEVHYMAVDSKGSVTRGEWIEHNGNPAIKSTRISSEGETKTILEHIKVDASTLKVKIYKQDDSGKAGDLAMEVEFKKQ